MRLVPLRMINQVEVLSHYLGYEVSLPTLICSPLRDDHKASFSLYGNEHGIWASDKATGKWYSLVDLVAEMRGISKNVAMLEIMSGDYGMVEGNSSTISIPETFISVESYREMTQEGKDYWQGYYVSQSTLAKYNVTQVKYRLNHKQEVISDYRKTLAFAYRNQGKYKVYKPVDREYRFYNNYNDTIVEGWDQLPMTANTLIIDKSTKDIMVCHELGFNAISPRSETCLLPDNKVHEIKQRFDNIIVMFDNDKAGREMSEVYRSTYGWKPTFLPENLAKDKSDAIKITGPHNLKTLINELIA